MHASSDWLSSLCVNQPVAYTSPDWSRERKGGRRLGALIRRSQTHVFWRKAEVALWAVLWWCCYYDGGMSVSRTYVFAIGLRCLQMHWFKSTINRLLLSAVLSQVIWPTIYFSPKTRFCFWRLEYTLLEFIIVIVIIIIIIISIIVLNSIIGYAYWVVGIAYYPANAVRLPLRGSYVTLWPHIHCRYINSNIADTCGWKTRLRCHNISWQRCSSVTATSLRRRGNKKTYWQHCNNFLEKVPITLLGR